MSERIQEVRTYRIDYRCDRCDKADMIAVSKIQGATTRKYVHRCNKCGAEDIFDVRYPRIVTRPVVEQGVNDVELMR